MLSFFYDELKLNTKRITRVTKIKNIKIKYNPRKTYFSFENNLWLCPNKEYKKLLCDEQIYLIIKGCFYNFKFQPVIHITPLTLLKVLYIKFLNRIS